MMKKIVIIVCILGLSACSMFEALQKGKLKIVPVSRMGSMINDSLRIPSLKNKETGILTFANLNKLNEAEPLGRYLQEKLSYSLFKNGFRIKELRLSKQISYIPGTGEFNISRVKSDLKAMGYGNLKSIIVGTYIDVGEHVYVNAKMVEINSGLVRASGEIKVAKSKALLELIKLKKKNKDNNMVFERFPVIRTK